VDVQPPLARLARSHFVLIGSATHGTEEFHRERTALTRELITRAGFRAVAVEAGWAEAERVDRYVCAGAGDRSAEQALDDLRRFPAWMWRNTVVAEFVAWLRGHNDALAEGTPHVRFYGIDLHDPAVGEPPPRRDAEPFAHDRRARAAIAGDEYRRWLPYQPVHAANVRALHMADTLTALADHLEGAGTPTRVAVWAHNGHVGDARATQLARNGERSVGQLMRQRDGAGTVLLGFTTYEGTVTAARDWEEPAQEMRLRPARQGSYEHLLHERGLRRQVLDPAGLPGDRLERAIGGVYRHGDEPTDNYLSARIGDQFDVLIHIDETHAVRSLE
jgi:erythromycin esterase-like protein